MKRRNFLTAAAAFLAAPKVLAKAPASQPIPRPMTLEGLLQLEAQRISEEIYAKFDRINYRGQYHWRNFSGPGKTGAFSGKF
jgi:hypothetical protein